MIIETTSIRGSAPTRQAVRVRPRRLILLAACWLYLLALVAIWLTMRLAGDRWWAATVLLMAPRWPFLLPLIILWPWSIIRRRWLPIATSAAATAFALFLIMGLRVALPAAAPERGELRLLTCNVHRQLLDTERLAELVAEARPDVIALQGWSDANHERLFAGSDWNVRRDGELLVASRYPIGSVTPLQIVDPEGAPPGEQGAAALVELKSPRGPVYLICLHLASPHGGLLTFQDDSGEKLTGNVERRWRESDRLLDLAEQVKGPLLLAGDFNTTDDSPIFREHWGGFADAFTERGSGFGYTYRIGHTQLRIDHILAGPSFEFVRCWVGPNIGSPHRPLVADVDCR